MKKVIRYVLIVVSIFVVTGIIVSLFFIRPIFRSWLAEEDNFSPIITRFLDKINRPPATPVVVRPEETIQIIEGWTNRDISQYFEKEGRFSSKEFFQVVGFSKVDYQNKKEVANPDDFVAEFSFLDDKPKNYSLEGYLFPDTYRIYASSTVSEVVEKMLVNFDKKLTPKMRADIKAQGKTIYEIVTLASIVEKEAPIDYQNGNNRDARIIAGIFLNRLRIGQGLQSDATLSYIFGDSKPAHSGVELENSSLYNTYKYRGLPPGPICNPGILALEAAIYPILTDYNYFLTPKGKAEVVYARTYEEHLQNKYKYLK
jgi:UPF0755 protein